MERPPWNHRPVPNPIGKVAEIRKKNVKSALFFGTVCTLCGKTPPYYCFHVWFKNKQTQKLEKIRLTKKDQKSKKS